MMTIPAPPLTDDRLPPHSLAAEMCLLGAMILGSTATVAEVMPLVREGDFYRDDHQVIFRHLRELQQAGRKVDAVVLRERLVAAGRLDEVGGTAYIGQLLHAPPSAAHAIEYAREVVECSRRRALIEAGNRLLRGAYSGQTPPDELAKGMMRDVADMAAGGDTVAQSIGELAIAEYERLSGDEPALIQTGCAVFDRVLGGIGRGEMIVVGARPSMGKSTLLRGFAVDMAMEGRRVGFVSLEEPSAKVLRNIFARLCSLENHQLRRRAGIDFSKLAGAVGKLHKLPVYLSTRAREIDQIRAVGLYLKARHNIDVLIVDHLSRVRVPRTSSPYHEVTAAVGKLSDLIKDLDVAGIVAAQLNRGLEGREDRRPGLADLRESGAVEEHADGVVFLHREDYYRANCKEHDRCAELLIAKWRDGERLQRLLLRSELQYQRFIEWNEPPPHDLRDSGCDY